MAVGRFYDEIDGILDSMTEYLGIRDDDDDDYYDDIFGEDDDDDDDYIDDVICTRDDVDKCGIVLEKYIDELIEIAKDLIAREAIPCEPELVLDTDKTDFYSFKWEDFKLVDYPTDEIKKKNPQPAFDLGV